MSSDSSIQENEITTSRWELPAGMSRRQFLVLCSGIVATSAVVGTELGHFSANVLFGTKKASPFTKFIGWMSYEYNRGFAGERSEEIGRLTKEIAEFRSQLGFSGEALTPRALKDIYWTEGWGRAATEFDCSVPESNRSYGERIDEVASKVFGANSERLLAGAKMDDRDPHGIYFESGSRYCGVSINIRSIPFFDPAGFDFTHTAVHEGVGHPSDSDLSPWIYPTMTLIRVTHGKWRALKEAFSVEGEFFNHPGDLMYPQLKRQMGVLVAKKFLEGELGKVFSVKGREADLARLLEVSESELRKMKFNKKRSTQVGEALLAGMRTGEVTLIGDYKKAYEHNLDEALVEIYAEMFRLALCDPEKIKDSLEITKGIVEIIEAIREGQVDIERLRQEIRFPSKKLIDRNQEETLAMDVKKLNESPVASKELTTEQKELMRKQQDEFEAREKLVSDFQEMGIVPEAPIYNDFIRQQLVEFGTIYSQIIRKYPMLVDTSTIHLDDSFDPELHVWEIEQIERAMDSQDIRGWLLEPENVDWEKTSKKLVLQTQILRDFVTSPEF